MIFATLQLLSFHPVYNCFPNSVSKNQWKVERACVFWVFFFFSELCTCLARVHRYEVWQCDDLGIVATVNHLVMRSRWPSYALPTPGRQARQARSHDSVHDIVSDFTIRNLKFATLIFTDDWESPLNFSGESFRCIRLYATPVILRFVVNN